MLPSGSTRLPGWPGVPFLPGLGLDFEWAVWVLCVWARELLALSAPRGGGGATHPAPRGGAAEFVSRHPA